MIDPTQPRPKGELEPVFDRAELSSFEAAHLLLYGTDYSLHHYIPEVKARVAAGDLLPFARAFSDGTRITDEEADGYNRMIRQDLADGKDLAAAWLYLDCRQMQRPLRDAGQALQEAAIRGEVAVLGRPNPDADLSPIPAMAWRDRGFLQINSGCLYRQRQAPMRDVDWFDLTFDRREVDALRSASWHGIGRPTPTAAAMAKADRLPFSLKPAVLAEGVKRLEEQNRDVTFEGLSDMVAAQWIEAGGPNDSLKGPKGLAANIRQAWRTRSTPLADLVQIAAKG